MRLLIPLRKLCKARYLRASASVRCPSFSFEKKEEEKREEVSIPDSRAVRNCATGSRPASSTCLFHLRVFPLRSPAYFSTMGTHPGLAWGRDCKRHKFTKRRDRVIT